MRASTTAMWKGVGAHALRREENWESFNPHLTGERTEALRAQELARGRTVTKQRAATQPSSLTLRGLCSNRWAAELRLQPWEVPPRLAGPQGPGKRPLSPGHQGSWHSSLGPLRPPQRAWLCERIQGSEADVGARLEASTPHNQSHCQEITPNNGAACSGNRGGSKQLPK